MAAFPASRGSRWLLVLTLATALSLCAWWLWRRPPETARAVHEAALDRAIEPVIEQHAAEVKLGFSSPGQTRRLARQLALDSVPYLAPADLDLWAELRLEVANRSPAACAQLWKGGGDELLAHAMAALGEARLRAWSEMLARGLALRLTRKPAPEPAPDAIERAVAAVTEGLPPSERDAFRADISRSPPSDERACQLFLLLSRGAQRLEPNLRIDLYRALSRQLRASSPPGAPAASR